MFITVSQQTVCEEGEITLRHSLDSQHRKDTHLVYHYDCEFAYEVCTKSSRTEFFSADVAKL